MQTTENKKTSTKQQAKTSLQAFFVKEGDNSFLSTSKVSSSFSQPVLQKKLEIGQPDDKYEVEADRVADQVVHKPNPEVIILPNSGPLVQKKCTTCEDEEEHIQKKPLARNITPLIQRRSINSGIDNIASDTVSSNIASSKGGGKTMDSDTKSFMEHGFATDFSNVRIHTDSNAVNLNKELNAQAFTVGNDIYFNEGNYQPNSNSGKYLLAHELTHTIQQIHRPVKKIIQRKPSPSSSNQLNDPISGNELSGYGFHAIGPEFTGIPMAEIDFRKVLIDSGLTNLSILTKSVGKQFRLKGSDLVYYVFLHPNLGVVARAYGSLGGYKLEGKKRVEYYSIYAYLKAKDYTKYRPVGGTGVVRNPSPHLGVMSGESAASIADLSANLRLIDTRLSLLASRYPSAKDTIIGSAITKAQAKLATLRSNLIGNPVKAQEIETTVQLLEWLDYDLKLIYKQQDQLIAKKARLNAVFQLRQRYAKVLEQLFEPQIMAFYAEAQQWAERLPIDIMLDALRQHGELNEAYLKDSGALINWVDDLRQKLNKLYKKRQQLAANQSDIALMKEIKKSASFLEFSIRGIQLFAQRLVAFEQFIKNKPGITDYPLIKAMNRLRKRVHSIKSAYDANDFKNLKTRVDKLEKDPHVQNFYRLLPAAMQVTQLIGRVGVTILAALATGGVGGLLTGSARAATTGITLRGALTFAGTAVLEAATFTALHSGLSIAIFGDKISFGSLLKDFAWNIGLFLVLRGVSGVSSTALRAAELKLISTPVQLTASYPFMHGWGLLRFRIERNRWPNKQEMDRMTAESILMLAGITVGSKGVQRWLKNYHKAKSLTLFHRDYGWRFDALEKIRIELGNRIKNAETAGKGNDPTELAKVKADASTLEAKARALLDNILKDKRFSVAQIRQDLNAIHKTTPNIAAELLAEAIGIPIDVGVHRAAKASYTYSNGKTSVLETALSTNYTVTKSTDAKTGLKTVTASLSKAPTLLFQERTAGALEFNPRVYDIQKLILDLSLKSTGAQKMLWRMLSDNGITKDVKQAITITRRQIKDLGKKNAGKSEDQLLQDLSKTGKLQSTSPKALVEAAQRLKTSGILRSPEWLEARGIENQIGVVAEWLSKEASPPAAGTRVLRRVTVTADLFEDAAGTVLVQDSVGKARVMVTPVEADLIYGRNVSGKFEVDTILNVKAGGGKGMAKSARLQNTNFKAILDAKLGDLVRLQLAKRVVYARVRVVTALDGISAIDLTGKLQPSTTISIETVGPKGTRGFSKTLSHKKSGIKSIAELLAELQLIRSGEY